MRVRIALLRAVVTATAGLGLALTTPAVAAPGSSITATDTADQHSVAGQTISSNTTIQVRGTGSRPGREYTLDLVEPDGTTYRQDTARANFGAAHPRIDLATTDQPNGPWTATLTGGGKTGFTLAVPPARVSGLAAHDTGGGITLRWTANPEPDIVGYSVRAPNGTSQTYSPAQAGCATGNSCAVGYRPATREAGTPLHFTVTAERDGACGCASQPLSGPAAEAAVRAPSSPTSSSAGSRAGNPASGSSFPNDGNGSGFRGDAVGSGGFTSGGRLQAFVPGTTGSLPRSASTGAQGGSVLPGGEGPGAARDPGGYKPTLTYPGGREAAAAGGGQREPGGSLLSAFEGSTTWRSLGLAAVLLLAATHLLLWLRRNPVDL